MSAHVSLNLLKRVEETDRMRDLPSLFQNEFNKFNNTGAQI